MQEMMRFLKILGMLARKKKTGRPLLTAEAHFPPDEVTHKRRRPKKRKSQFALAAGFLTKARRLCSPQFKPNFYTFYIRLFFLDACYSQNNR